MNREIRKLSQSFRCAARGVLLCVRFERNFRIHTCTAAYVTLFGLMARFDKRQFAVLCVCYAMMFSAELLNTAVERLCDRGSGGYDSLVRDAKDLAAAAVFVSALFCVVIGGLYFLQADALCAIFKYLNEHLWAVMVLIASVPAAILYIFGSWRRI